jgi:hypothetical protein
MRHERKNIFILMLPILLVLLAQVSSLVSGLAFFALTLTGFLLLILFTWAVVQLFHDDVAIKRKGVTGLLAFFLIVALLAGARGALDAPSSSRSSKTGVVASGSWLK